MAKRKRTQKSALTSTSLARLMRDYKVYCINCILETEPIMSLKNFYSESLKEYGAKKSYTFEKYLVSLEESEWKNKNLED